MSDKASDLSHVDPITNELNLWQKLATIAEEGGRIGKTGKNSHFNYNFIEHSEVVAVFRPLLAKYGVTIDLEILDVPTFGNGQTLLKMRYAVTNADNPTERFERLWFSEAIDKQDKGINKALTAAEKNVFMKLFHVSDADPDADEPEQTKPAARPIQQQQARPASPPVAPPPANSPAFSQARLSQLVAEYELKIGNANTKTTLLDIKVAMAKDLINLEDTDKRRVALREQWAKRLAEVERVAERQAGFEAKAKELFNTQPVGS